MNSLNQWLTLVANFGVVAGFILIAFQLQQNTEALRLQADAISSNTHTVAESAMMGDDVAEAYAVALQSPHKLTDAQWLQASGYMITSLMAIQQVYIQYDRGLVSEIDWGESRRFALTQLNSRFAGAFWSSTKIFFLPAFVAEIDKQLVTSQEGDTGNIIKKMKHALEEEGQR
jgi:hypothetical protein